MVSTLASPQLSGTAAFADDPEIQAYDSDLDYGITPDPDAIQTPTTRKPEYLENQSREAQSLVITQAEPFDTDSNSFTLAYALRPNQGSEGGTQLYSTFGFLYALQFGQYLFFANPKIQDSLHFEIGVFHYKILGYGAQKDQFSVTPILMSARYNLAFSDRFQLFFYGGATPHLIGAGDASSIASAEELGQTRIALGTGILTRIAPKWWGRFQVGADGFSAGLLLRF